MKKENTELTLERYLKAFPDFDEVIQLIYFQNFNVEPNQMKVIEFKNLIQTTLNNIKE